LDAGEAERAPQAGRTPTLGWPSRQNMTYRYNYELR